MAGTDRRGPSREALRAARRRGPTGRLMPPAERALEEAVALARRPLPTLEEAREILRAAER